MTALYIVVGGVVGIFFGGAVGVIYTVAVGGIQSGDPRENVVVGILFVALVIGIAVGWWLA